MINNFIKQLIEGLCADFNYNIIEYLIDNTSKSLWGITQKETGKKLLFLSIKDFEEVNSSIEVNHTINENNCIKILLIDSKEEYTKYTKYENIIIVDYNFAKVLFYSHGNELVVNQIEYVFNKKYKVVSNKNKSNPYVSIPYVTIILIAINLLMYLITAVLSVNFMDADVRVLVFLGAKYNPLIENGEYYRLFTCMFLHGGLLHIGFNMYALYALGPFIEKVYGKLKFIIIYLFSGLIASLFSYFLSAAISVGASGAIFGLIGAALIFGLKMKNVIGKGFLSNIISVIMINLIIGITVPNIDNYGHIGGLIGGIIIATMLFKNK